MGVQRRFVSGMVAAVALVASAGQTHAQTGAATLLEPPRHRQGYYLSAGLGGLVSHVWDHNKGLGAWGGSAFTLRMGQLLTRRFGLGLQIDNGSSAKGDDRAAVIGVSMAGQWELANNLAVHGGLGLGVISLSNVADPDADLRGAVGAGYFLGVSYDWFPWKTRLTGGYALTPFVQARLIPTDTFDVVAGVVGVQLTWWSGLPDNQLQLPESEAYKRR